MQAAIDNTKVKEVTFLNPFLNDFPCDAPETTDQNPSQQLLDSFQQPVEEDTSYFPQEVVFQNLEIVATTSTIISSETDIDQNCDAVEIQQIQSTFNNFETNATDDICDTSAPAVEEVFGNSNNHFNNFSVVQHDSVIHQDSYVEQQEFSIVQHSYDEQQESIAVEQESVVIQNAPIERDLLFSTNLDESCEIVVPTPSSEGRLNKPGPPPRPPPLSKQPIPIPDEPLLMQVIPGVGPYYSPQPVTLMSLNSPCETLNKIHNTSQNTSMSVAAPTITQIFKTPEQGD